jgi:hypothetical protein
MQRFATRRFAMQRFATRRFAMQRFATRRFATRAAGRQHRPESYAGRKLRSQEATLAGSYVRRMPPVVRTNAIAGKRQVPPPLPAAVPGGSPAGPIRGGHRPTRDGPPSVPPGAGGQPGHPLQAYPVPSQPVKPNASPSAPVLRIAGWTSAWVAYGDAIRTAAAPSRFRAYGVVLSTTTGGRPESPMVRC